ncbi:unnamed protein product, partial [Rotaria socialis]
ENINANVSRIQYLTLVTTTYPASRLRISVSIVDDDQTNSTLQFN